MGRFDDFAREHGANPYVALAMRHSKTVADDAGLWGAFLHGDVAKLPAAIKGSIIDTALGTLIGVPGELAGQLTGDALWSVLATAQNASGGGQIGGRELEARMRGTPQHAVVGAGTVLLPTILSAGIGPLGEAGAGGKVAQTALRAVTGNLADPALERVLGGAARLFPAARKAAAAKRATPTLDNAAVDEAIRAADAAKEAQEAFRRAKYSGQPIDADFTAGPAASGSGAGAPPPRPAQRAPAGPAAPSAASPAVRAIIDRARALPPPRAATTKTPATLAELAAVPRLPAGRTPLALPAPALPGAAEEVTAALPDYSIGGVNERVDAQLSGQPAPSPTPPRVGASPVVAQLRDKAKLAYGKRWGHQLGALLKREGAAVTPDGSAIMKDGEEVSAHFFDYLDKKAALPERGSNAAQQALRDELAVKLGGLGGFTTVAETPYARTLKADPTAPAPRELDDAAFTQTVNDWAGGGQARAVAAARADSGLAAGAPAAGAALRAKPTATNYVVPLNTYTDRLYRQAEVGELVGELTDWGPSGLGGGRDIHFANTPDLALGQGTNAGGVLMEFEASGLEGQVNRDKPAWQPAWDAGVAEFVGRRNGGMAGMQALKAVTIPDKLPLNPVQRRQMPRFLLRLVNERGFTPHTLPDGAVRYEAPGYVPAAEVAQATPPAAPTAPIEFGGGTRTSVSDQPIPTGPAAPLKLEMQYGGLPETQVDRLKQTAAGQADMFGDAPTVAGDTFDETQALRQEFRDGLTQAVKTGKYDEVHGAMSLAEHYGYSQQEAEGLLDDLTNAPGDLVRQERERIEASPYYKLFKYFRPDGTLKRVNPKTGKPIRMPRGTGGRYRGSGDAVWNQPGTGYDDLAAEVMAETGGYSAAGKPDTDAFWDNVTKARQQYLRLRKGLPPSRDFDWRTIGGMGAVAPLPPASVSFGAAGGALAGGVAGAATGDTPEERARNAAIGALGGTIGGAVAGPRAAGALRTASKSAPAELAAMGMWKGVADTGKAWREGGVSLAALRGAAKKQLVETPGGALLDTVSNYMRAVADKIPLAKINASRRSIVRRMKAGQNASYDDGIDTLLTSVGLDPEEFDWGTKLGHGAFHVNEGEKPLHPLAAGMLGAAMAGVGPGGAIPVVGHAAGFIRGLGQEFVSAGFRTFNDADQTAARAGAYTHEAEGLLEQAAAQFKAALADHGFDVSKLPESGRFTPEQADLHVYGAGELWRDQLRQIFGETVDPKLTGTAKNEAVKTARGLAADSVTATFGDYGTPGQREKFLNAFLLFSRYTLGQYPVLLRMAAENPAAATALAKLVGEDQRSADEEGRPGYLTGTIPISTETPGLGGLMRLGTGGVKGEGRIAPLNALLNLGGETLSLGQQDKADPTAYERVQGALGTIGLNPTPAVDAAMYVLGQTDRAPSVSRLAGFEGAMPGPTLPSGASVLNRVRQALGFEDASFDPVKLRAQEIVLRETGLPAIDPRNAALADQLRFADSPLMQRAAAEVGHGSALKNLISVASPIRPQYRTAEKIDYQQAKADQREAIAAGLPQTGAAAVYRQPKLPPNSYKQGGGQEDPRVVDFMNQYSGIRQHAPQTFAMMLAEFKRKNHIR